MQAGNLRLLERSRTYIHLPTASLQLVYDVHLELPCDARGPSLHHADERLESGPLVAHPGRRCPDFYLLPLGQGRSTGDLFTLYRGQLCPVAARSLRLTGSFAVQDG